MTDDAQRHMEATREEPPDGQSREQWIKSRLKTILRDPVIFQMCSREETATGRALTRFFTDYTDIKMILALGHLDATQQRIIALQYGPPDLPIDEVARMVNRDRSTVYRRRHYALEYLIRVYYDEPEYVLPWRNQARSSAREAVADYLREIGV